MLEILALIGFVVVVLELMLISGRLGMIVQILEDQKDRT